MIIHPYLNVRVFFILGLDEIMMFSRNTHIKLTNARISDICFSMLNNKNPELVKLAKYVEICFVFQKIQCIWVDGGEKNTNDWHTREG